MEAGLAAALLVLTLAGISPQANAAAYYVGNGPNCYATLRAALTASESDPDAEIRLTGGVFQQTERLFIGRNLVMRGGYLSCSDSTPSPGVESWLLNTDFRTLYLDGDRGDRRRVLIEKVNFLGSHYWDGTGDAPTVSAGGLVVRGPLDLTLRSSRIEYVHARPTGGAIKMMTTAVGTPEVRLEETTISQASSSDNGGAISCEGGTLHIRDGLLIEAYSPSRGGAIHASDCTVHLVDTELRNNSGAVGGALYVGGAPDASSRLFAENTLVTNNHGFNSAGGIALQSAEGYLKNVQLLGNSSAVGASIHVYGAFLRMEGRGCTLDEVSQPVASGCSGIGAHEVGIDSSSITVRNDSLLHLTQTTLAHHMGVARAYVIDSLDSSVIFQNSTLTGNTAMEHLLRFRAAGQPLRLEQVSIHGNSLQTGRAHIAVEDPGSPDVRVINSIFEGYSRGFPLMDGVASPDIHCMVTDQPLAATGGRRDTDAPGIAGDGIHLLPDSPAIDFCEAVLFGDVDGDDRPVDVAGIDNPGPTRFTDAGADEFIPVAVSDAIYSDRFSQPPRP